MKFLFLIIVLLFLSCTTTDGVLKQQEPGAIRLSGDASKEAIIFLNGTSVGTITEGNLIISDVPSGTQKLTLFSSGSALVEKECVVEADDTVELRYSFESTTSGDLSIISDSGAVVTIDELTFGAVNSSGTFTIDGFPSGTYALSVTNGSKSVDSMVTLVDGGELSLSLQLSLQQQILIEHISNVSCEYCPEHAERLYHILDSLEWKGISKISYNANWPAKDDPLYLFDPKPQMDRTMLYGGKVNYALPIFVVNGKVISFDADGEKLKKLLIEEIEKEQQKKPLFDIGLDGSSIEVTSLSEDTFEGTLFVTLVQDRVEFDSAPGSNGEKLFLNAFRRVVLKEEITIESGKNRRFTFDVNTSDLPSSGLRLTAFIQTSDDAILQTTDYKL